MKTVTVSGRVVAETSKAVCVRHDNNRGEAWYSRRHTSVLEGFPIKGEWVRLAVPQWLYDRANGNEIAPAKKGGNQSDIPPDMLKRLIHLCHPDKHDGSKAATIATEWLLQQKAGQ